MRFESLSFLLTNKCPARCASCSFSSGPELSTKMSLESAYSCIDQAAEVSSIQRVCFTGGEPLLFFDELLRIARYASAQGFVISCVTNGFWACSEVKTSSMLKQLRSAGVSVLCISADSFHQKYVPLENIKRILRLARKVGIQTVLNTTVINHSQRLLDLLREIGDLSVEAAFFESPVLPIGRAVTAIDREEFFAVSGIPKNRCSRMTDLAVSPDGDVYPCCSQGGMTRPLLMGNVASETLREMVDKSSKNFLYSLLEWYGPACFVPAIEEEGLGHMLDTAYVNECHLCYEILSNPELAEIAVKVVKHEEILHLKRALEKALLIS